MYGTRQAVSVSQINEYMKMLVESDYNLGSVLVRGEISNFTSHYKTGHLYFTLKDETGLLKAVMFRSSAVKLKFIPQNGMKVVVGGRISVFVRDGQYQLYADSMEPDGIGALYAAFEQLKEKLAAQGLFDESRKKPLPPCPSRIGVITSPTGAAVRDIINILGRRYPMAAVEICGVTVQGEDAPRQLRAAVEYMNARNTADVIIIGRGGGSIEDLWAFNDEGLARAIAASHIPIISAVGHETDFTICDFVSDRRAPTPSAAAELAVPDRGELKRRVSGLSDRMAALISGRVEAYRGRVELLSRSRVMRSPMNMIDDKRMAVLSLSSRMESGAKLSEHSGRAALAALAGKLDALSPLSVISRGYSAVFSEDGRVVKSAEQLSVGDSIRLKMSDGSVDAAVTGKYTEDNEK